MLILGFLILGGFCFVEQRVARPIIPNGLWRIPGFAALMVSYFLGQGAYSRFSTFLGSRCKIISLTFGHQMADSSSTLFSFGSVSKEPPH
jgi:hypothetical protein